LAKNASKRAKAMYACVEKFRVIKDAPYVWGQKSIWWLKYITKSSPMYGNEWADTRVWEVQSEK
jgi:hypothetical protein